MQVRNCTKWWGPNSHILIYYIEQSRKEIYLVTSAKGEWNSQAPWEFCTREEVASAFEGFHPEVRTVIETAPQLTKWPILDIKPIDKWSERQFGAAGGRLPCHDSVHGIGRGHGHRGCGGVGPVPAPVRRSRNRICALPDNPHCSRQQSATDFGRKHVSCAIRPILPGCLDMTRWLFRWGSSNGDPPCPLPAAQSGHSASVARMSEAKSGTSLAV